MLFIVESRITLQMNFSMKQRITDVENKLMVTGWVRDERRNKLEFYD